MLGDLAQEISYSVIGVQTLLECDAHENHSLRSKRKPHECTDMLLQPFFCDPVGHGKTDPSFHACWMQDVLCHCWKSSHSHSFRELKQSIYRTHTSHT